MRILCVNLKKASNTSIVDIFLKFSPRVQFREPNWVFIDITASTPLFESESLLIDECIHLCSTLNIPISAAIGDTPWGAQVLSQYYERCITNPGEEILMLGTLPIESLVWLEGLTPWHCPPSHLEQMASLFKMLGFTTLAQIHHLNRESFHERWGSLGKKVWERLHSLDQQVISPYIPEEPLHFYQHLDFPISQVSLLLGALEKGLTFLFARLQGRGLFAQRLSLILHCEYSETRYAVHIDPANANRDLPLFMTLLQERLSSLNLENPIRDLEIDILACEEKQRQLNFWEPHSSDQDKLQRLVSLLQQTDCEAGFYQLRNAVFPEKTWVMNLDCSHNAHSSNPHSTRTSASNKTRGAGSYTRSAAGQKFEPIKDEVDVQENAYQVRQAYGQSVMHAPRPTRLLQKPRPLPAHEFRSLQLLSQTPIERLEDEWWQKGGPHERDYYFAVSPQGQCLWVYQDRISNAYYLHGYFD